MKLRLALICALIAGPAFAQGGPVQYRASDNINNIPVSVATPLPVTNAGATSGSSSNASDGQATSATNVPTVSYNYVWNGTTWDRLPGNATNGLRVSVQPATTTRTNGTITTANTFQSVLASSATRKDCRITNTSVNAMTVDDGASPAAATAIPLPAGSAFVCSTYNIVVTDQINLTSATAGSTFVVWSQ